MSDYVLIVERSVLDDSESYFQRLHDFLSRDCRGRVDYEGLVDVAGKGIDPFCHFGCPAVQSVMGPGFI